MKNVVKLLSWVRPILGMLWLGMHLANVIGVVTDGI